jgi:beta-N-acetylhexosaminidase
MKISEIGRRLIVGFDGLDVNDEIRFALRELGAGGVILFTRNYEEPEQLRELVVRLRELCVHDRLWVCVDQEGGKVQRFKEPFTIWPDMASFTQYGDLSAAQTFARYNARELRAVGVDWNFAPVADLNTCAQNPIIGRRSFSGDASEAAEYVEAVIQGFQSEGVMACAKHFPGHGDTRADSHVELPVDEREARRISEVEFIPFKAAARAGVASIMTAHVQYPAFDESLPATFSSAIIAMAREFPFDGLMVSDDLEMAAVADRYGMADAAMMATSAGCDILLCCHDVRRQEEIVRGLYDAVLSEKVPRRVMLDSAKRIQNALVRFPNLKCPPLSEIGRNKHWDLAERVRSASDV